MRYEDIVGVWRKESVDPVDTLRSRLRYMVFSPERETWEVYPWPVEFDDDPGAPMACVLNSDGAIARHVRHVHHVGKCQLSDIHLRIEWHDGMTYMLVREGRHEEIERWQKRPQTRDRTRQDVPGVGEVGWYPRMQRWEGSIVIDGFLLDVHIQTTEGPDDPALARAGQVCAQLRNYGVLGVLRAAAPQMVELWQEAWEHGDGSARDAPSVELVAAESIPALAAVNAHNLSVSFRHESFFTDPTMSVVLDDDMNVVEVTWE